jgi:hypothetical protein
MKRGFIGCALLALSSIARADIITLDPNQFAVGTNISHAWNDVTLRTVELDYLPRPGFPEGVRPPIFYEDVYSAACWECAYFTPDSLNAFGFWGSNGLGQTVLTSQFFYSNYAGDVLRGLLYGEPMQGGWSALEIDFDNATNFVQVASSGSTGNYFIMDAWAEDGSWLGRADYQGRIPDPFTLDFSTGEEKKIKSVTIGGWQGGRYVQNVSYNAPEPATAVLMAAALLGLVVSARRWRTRSCSRI